MCKGITEKGQILNCEGPNRKQRKGCTERAIHTSIMALVPNVAMMDPFFKGSQWFLTNFINNVKVLQVSVKVLVFL